MSYIGIDLGTSFIKGAVLDPKTLTIEHVRRIPFPDPLPGHPPLHREFDPQAVLAATRSLLTDLLHLADEPALSGADGCEGIVMCSQMHGLVFTTAQGAPASNLTSWLDQRTLEPHPSGRGSYFDVLAGRLTPDEIRQLGNQLRPGLPLGVLFWLAEQGQLPRQDLIPASLPDFVLGNLCATIPTTESTNAAAHGALNMETLDWHHAVLGKLGLNGLRWPRLRKHGDIVGQYKTGGRAIPCYTPVGDYQAALTGALVRRGELSLNISTGSQASVLLPHLASGAFQTLPFFDSRFLATVSHIPAGRALGDLVALFSELAVAQGVKLSDPWSYIATAARRAGSTRMRVDLAFFNSSCGDHGAFTDVREEELTVGHIFSAAFQNMADNYYRSAQRLVSGVTDEPLPWRNLVFSGGLVQKLDVLRERIVDRFGVGYRVCPTTEDALLGLLGLGLAFTGRTASVAEATERIYAAYGGDNMLISNQETPGA